MLTNLKEPIFPLLLGVKVFDVKTTYRKSCAPNLLLVFRFDLGPLLQGQMWFFIPIYPLLLVIEVLDVKTTYRKSCAPNLLVGSDLTLDPSFKVECGP